MDLLCNWRMYELYRSYFDRLNVLNGLIHWMGFNWHCVCVCRCISPGRLNHLLLLLNASNLGFFKVCPNQWNIPRTTAFYTAFHYYLIRVFFCLVPRGHVFYVKCLISRCINTTCPIALHFNPQQIILRSFQVDIMLIISFDCIQFGKCIYFWLFFTCIERCSVECESFRRQNVWIGVRWVNQIKQWTNLKSNYSTHIPNCECWNNS